jgi:hypothetical protein
MAAEVAWRAALRHSVLHCDDVLPGYMEQRETEKPLGLPRLVRMR